MMHLTRAQPLYGVLLIKDELYNPINSYGNESDRGMSLLPLISYVIKHMQL